MHHRPRKRFGQNFLQDQAIIQQIIQGLHLEKKDNVVEIGPGQGALTQPLLACLDQLTAVEIDRDLQDWLKSQPNAQRLNLIAGDALNIDYSDFGNHQRIIGNLPYNISTPLILHLLNYTTSIKDMHFMLQKEVVDRLAATPGTKDYGRLSVMVQYYCTTIPLFDVPPEAFYPKPKVFSTIIGLIPHKISPFPSVPIHQLEKMVAQSFSMRRKTLANNLKKIFSPADLIGLDIDPTLRPEQLSVMDFVRLCQHSSRDLKG